MSTILEEILGSHSHLESYRVILGLEHLDDIKKWNPTWPAFEELTRTLVWEFASTAADHDALKKGDKVLAHSIFIIRDSLMFMEFNDAIKQVDVGRMWMVYNHWIFMMRGAGLHNYGNKLLEMKAQFLNEYSGELCKIVKHTWLVNQWGVRGKSIPTDLYLEHNNGFTKVCSAMHLMRLDESDSSVTLTDHICS